MRVVASLRGGDRSQGHGRNTACARRCSGVTRGLASAALAQAREIKDPQRLLPSLADLAVCHALLGHEDEARELANEALEVARDHVDLASILNMLAVVSRQLGIQDRVREIVQLAPEGPWKDVTLAAAEGDFVRVADAFAGFGALSSRRQMLA